jgi:hypothetical protein
VGDSPWKLEIECTTAPAGANVDIKAYPGSEFADAFLRHEFVKLDPETPKEIPIQLDAQFLELIVALPPQLDITILDPTGKKVFSATGKTERTQFNLIYPNQGTYLVKLLSIEGMQKEDVVAVALVLPKAINQPPTANAGEDQRVRVGQQVVLDGSGSFDPEGDTLIFNWRQIKGPLVSLNNPTSQNPSFIPEEVGIYEFELVVTDGKLESSPDVVVIEVVSEEGVFLIELVPYRGWCMFTIPINLTDSNVKAVLEQLNLPQIKLFHYHAGGYLMWGEIQDNPLVNFKPGLAYWLKLDQTATLKVSGEPVKPDEEGKFVISLYKGWNQVGKPCMDEIFRIMIRCKDIYGNEVDYDLIEAIDRRIIRPYFWTWEKPGRYVRRHLFEIEGLMLTKGFWVKALKECSLILIR